MLELDIRKELESLRTMYTKDLAQETFNALIVGQKGIGKTQLAITCRKPVLIHSFDPGGTKHLRPEIAKGEIIVDTRFEEEDGRKPTAWALWEKEFDRFRRGEVFQHIGTYMLDSLTMMQQALMNYIATLRGGKFSNDGVLEIKGWMMVVTTLRDVIKVATSLPCDFILTGHVTRSKDDVSGKHLISLALPPSLQIPVPTLFDEYYYMTQNEKGRVLQTEGDDRVAAGTRLGRGRFQPFEEPNIKHLLKLIGLSTEDKPLFMEG